MTICPCSRLVQVVVLFVATLVMVQVQHCSVDAFHHHLVPVRSSPVFLSSSTRSVLSFSVIQMSVLSSDQQNDSSDDDEDDFSIRPTSSCMNQRRSLLHQAALFVTMTAVTTTTVSSTLLLRTPTAHASGGATAGRYTTIPIAKRRYYGRVQQAVHEFVEMGKDMKLSQQDATATSSSNKIQDFFDLQGTVIVPSKRTDVNGQCTKKDGDCRGKEIRDSRYNDMKASMYLLANAFRTDQQKPPDRLPTVKAARAFFQKVDSMEKIVVKSNKSKAAKVVDTAIVQLYVDALDILDAYLDLVELPPIDSGHYEQEFDTLVGESARIT